MDSGVTFTLPEVGAPEFLGDGQVRVGEYTFDEDTVASALKDEATYFACAMVARSFFTALRDERRKGRMAKAAQIAYDTFYDGSASTRPALEEGSLFYRIAESILDAVEEGEL